MNPDPSSSGSSGPSSQNQRKERGAIAAQACDNCRARKHKCDEQRPKCSLCKRMNLECNYREPQPTKKDKTLVEILDRLKSLEIKIDRLSGALPYASPGFISQASPRQPPSHISFSVTNFENQPPYPTPSFQRSQIYSPNIGKKSIPYKPASASLKILTWPAMQQLLLQAIPSSASELKMLDQEGLVFLNRVHKVTSIPHLPLDEHIQDQPFIGMQTPATRMTGAPRSTFPALSPGTMRHLATAYFDTFNFMYPFMDRQTFMSETLSKVLVEGFNGDTESVIALLVFALGELAIEGIQGKPIGEQNGRLSGVRGGTSTKPPGLALFNEARKRIGFTLTECDLENVQIYSLAGIYLEACCRHLEFWRMNVAASAACQVLLTSSSIDWDTPRGDVIRRAYWHCAIMETSLHLEIDLPLTGILDLENRVGIPSFSVPLCEEDVRGNQATQFEAHYASHIALRRLCANLSSNISKSPLAINYLEPDSEDTSGPTFSSLKLFTSQLRQWRGMLPRELQWVEEDPTSYPYPHQNDPTFAAQLDPSLPGQGKGPERPMFFLDIDAEPLQYLYVYDIQVALLRTRYYFAKYMAHLPFIYKALHYPEDTTQEDAENVAECLRSCIKWPLLLSPVSRHKRLIPYLFSWSQCFLGILLIFHVTKHNPMLFDIRTRLCGPSFEIEVASTTALMVDWIRDLKGIDAVAEWCWRILQGVYHAEL
ncbi:hypothetical protein F5884DRAFT_169964 [Xylogone sp. PMI_703]|nr:hypothetical protein F5884DRAFT_169964 [Xylogone sp. PMI_703]